MAKDQATTSSGALTASAAIFNMSAQLCGLDLLPPTSGTVTLTLYDNPTAASGNVLAAVSVTAGNNSEHKEYGAGIIANAGIYAALTGSTTGASCVVRFSAGG